MMILLILLCFSGCIKKINTCPSYPLPSEHVITTLNKLSETDKEIYVWLNQLLDLCQKLETCE